MFNKIFLLPFLIIVFFTTNAMSSESEERLNTLLQQHNGSVIYVDFWASWCGPCRKSFPWMNTMQNKYDGLKIISINVDNDKSFATKFLEKTPANFPIIYDPKGMLAKQYKLKGMPSSYIFNKRGKLVSTHVGFTETKKAQYELELQSLLNE